MSALVIVGRNDRWPHRMRPLVSYAEYADGTDGRTPDRYITYAFRYGRG